MIDMVLIELDNDSFEEKIYDDEETAAVVFSRKNCHVCKVVVPMVEELADSYTEREIGFYRVDVEDQPALYSRFPLKGVPSVLFFSEGEFKGRLSGEIEEEQVAEKIDGLLGSVA